MKKSKKDKSTTLTNESRIADNRKAFYEYHIDDRYEAGIVLLGSEVKSTREGKMNLRDSFVRVHQGEVFLHNCHISLYSKIQGYEDLDTKRTRKLLLNRNEIAKLQSASERKGMTIIPTKAYFKRGRIKIEIAVARGKQLHDKRESIKRRIHDREAQAAIKKNLH